MSIKVVAEIKQAHIPQLTNTFGNIEGFYDFKWKVVKHVVIFIGLDGIHVRNLKLEGVALLLRISGKLSYGAGKSTCLIFFSYVILSLSISELSPALSNEPCFPLKACSLRVEAQTRRARSPLCPESKTQPA
jgi:hypothetical protein